MTNFINKEILIEIENGSSRPFEKAVIDHICLDTLVYCPGKKAQVGRPGLTILLDDYSRRVLAFYLSSSAPTYVSNMTVIRE